MQRVRQLLLGLLAAPCISTGCSSTTNTEMNVISDAGAFGGTSANASTITSAAGGSVHVSSAGASSTAGASLVSSASTGFGGDGGGTGGAQGFGGVRASGGVGSLGSSGAVGNPSSGGTLTTGGAPNTGGFLATGGQPMTGGAPATGGNVSAAGAPSNGGRLSTGGVESLGGAPLSNGVATTGGVEATGGVVSTGGVAPSGGASPIGGTDSITGGVASAGGTSASATSSPSSEACANTSPTIGSPGTCCPPEASYGCSANRSVHKVLCINGLWTANGDCDANKFCDTRPGVNAGACKSEIAECSGKDPGDAVCNGQSVETCGPDLVSVTKVQTCDGATPVCLDGACVACKPNDTRCDAAGSNGVQTCDSTGTWGKPVACSDPAKPLCSASSCRACPGTGGPTMVGLPLNYCIDSTEVTNAQYQAWLNTNPSSAGQPTACAWNTSFTPTGAWPPPSANLNNPVAYVDWCDATAYCKGMAKRLCGKIGGGSNEPDDVATAALSQWYAACSSNGKYSYPYGDTYSVTTCNGGEAGRTGTLPVGSQTGCQSSVTGYTGVFDLSGNLAEWVDSCSGTVGATDDCRIVSGGYSSSGPGATACTWNTHLPRDTAYVWIGFRCCSP